MTTAQADNITMSGGGLYSLATIGAKDVIDLATPRVLEALTPLLESNQGQWNFCDMGCADGGTSLELWRKVINRVRQTSASDIQVVYADQARNDFNALIQILHGHTEFNTYLPEFEHVSVLASGSSFYAQTLPADSLHLGFSATAMHWLSRKPCNISNHVHMVGAEEKDAVTFAAQARSDWETILLHRARELKVGGKLVLINFCRDQQGRYLGNTGGINMFDNFNAIWQQFLADGEIDQAEYDAMTLPQYYNSVDEFSAPLLDQKSAVYQSGLRLIDIDTAVVPCPFAADYRQHQDAGKFSREYIPTIRSWNESIFYGGLSTSRSAADRTHLIERYYGEYQRQVADNPQGHGMDYVHAYMTIERV